MKTKILSALLLFIFSPVGQALAWHQVRLRNAELFVLGVAIELDDLAKAEPSRHIGSSA